jgi:5,10-methylenetetrahydromethanopterin reductase
VLALAAKQTRTLRIGPGTAICGTRIPPVQVGAMTTLNRIAPGRVFLGIGTGNTALRSMGQKPMKIADFSEYLRVLPALLRELIFATGNDAEWLAADFSREVMRKL